MSHRITYQQILWAMFLTFGGLAFLMLMSDPALAAFGDQGAQSFSCYDGKAEGDLIMSAADCPSRLTKDNIFSYLVCHVESISSQIFGNMYCGVIVELIPAVQAVLTLAVVTFGVAFTVGVVPATGREAIVFLLKIAFVLAFATQAEYMIGYGYNFFVGGLREGTVVAMSGLVNDESGNPIDSTADVYGFLDSMMGKMIGFATAESGETWNDDNNPCKNALFAMVAIMAIAFPPLFLLSGLFFMKMMMFLLRAIFGYMFSIVGIAFLMTLAPIFLSMALFKQTRKWFDKYLGYLASFTLQMVIIFTFIAFIFSIKPFSLIDNMASLVVKNEQVIETDTFRWPWQYCTLCKFEIVRGGTLEDDGTITGGTVLPDGDRTNPATDLFRCEAGADGTPYTVLNSANPGPLEDGSANKIMEMAGTTLLGLVILIYVIDQIIHYVPSIAWRLASSLSGGVYAPQVISGGGFHGQAPGVSNMAFDLTDRVGEGFYASYTEKMREAGSNSITAAGAGLEGAQRGLRSGLTGSLAEFFFNPTRTRHDEY
ncbi:MAG: type IV secretion system protein [Alphaproteobacteria bacterium]|nr:type IV secretion system protein [Alphaproteobacteria bacterium]